jgi:hypothetical protein
MQRNRFFQQGNSTESGQAEFLPYDPIDSNWWLGRCSEKDLQK